MNSPIAKTANTGIATISIEAAKLAQNAHSDNTKIAYQHGLSIFLAAGHSLPATPEVVADFIASARKEDGQPYSAASMALTIAAIAKAHKTAGFENPCASEIVKATLKGYKKSRLDSGETRRQAKPVLLGDLHRLVAAIDRADNPDKIPRDKALLLLWWAGLFRRSEVAALKVENIEFTDAGATITLPRSKTDQEGRGATVGFKRARDKSVCPVLALEQLVKHLGAKSGFLFRNLDRAGKSAGSLTAVSANRILKGYAQAAGLEWKKISGHSMRRGGATEAADRKVPMWKVVKHGRWKDTRMLDQYYIEAQAIDDSPMGEFL
jgi:integrase